MVVGEGGVKNFNKKNTTTTKFLKVLHKCAKPWFLMNEKKLQTGRGFFRIQDSFNTRIIFMSLDSAASNRIFQYYTFFQTLMIVLGIILCGFFYSTHIKNADLHVQTLCA